MACCLSDFKLPDPDVRLVLLNDTVFKIKLWFRSENPNGKKTEKDLLFWEEAKIQYDIERVITYVLLNQDGLEPIRTDDLVIYPYKKQWPRASNLQFSKFDKALKTSPYVHLFFIEKISRASDEPPVKKRILDVNLDTYQLKDLPAALENEEEEKVNEKLSSQDEIKDLSVKKTEAENKRRRRSQEEPNVQLCDIRSRLPAVVMATPINKRYRMCDDEKFDAGVHNPSYVASFLNLLLTPMKQIRNIWKN